MAMIVKIKNLSLMSVLHFSAFSVIVLSGCGNTPPPGATLTVATFGPVIISDTTGTNPTKTQQYRVTMQDADKNPLQGVDVNLQGFFTSGDGILFNGGAVLAGSASSSVTTNDSGYVNFPISAPTYTVRQLSPPSNVSATPLTTGGSLVAGTYSYCVTALDAATPQGETTCSSLASATTTTGGSSVTITWDAEAGARNYRVYGRTTGDGLLSILPSTTLTFTDTGSPVTPGAAPPVGNGTGIAINTVKGTVMATTGPLLSTVDVSF